MIPEIPCAAKLTDLVWDKMVNHLSGEFPFSRRNGMVDLLNAVAQEVAYGDVSPASHRITLFSKIFTIVEPLSECPYIRNGPL